jgi:hypothetical protein
MGLKNVYYISIWWAKILPPLRTTAIFDSILTRFILIKRLQKLGNFMYVPLFFVILGALPTWEGTSQEFHNNTKPTNNEA